MKKLLPILIIAGIVALGAFFIAQSNDHNNAASGDETGMSAAESHLAGANQLNRIEALNQAEVTIDIENFTYDPTVLVISEGTTVTWINNDRAAHDVKSADDSPMQGLDSNLLRQGDTYSYTFTETGEYFYFCSPHPRQMRAIIEVI